MFDDEPVTPILEELLLTNEDFPANFVNFAHPDDYIISQQAITPERIFHQYHGRHPRLIFRVSTRISENEYIPISYVLDTGHLKFIIVNK